MAQKTFLKTLKRKVLLRTKLDSTLKIRLACGLNIELQTFLIQ